MKAKEFGKQSNSKWLEGLILLVVLVIIFFVSVYAEPKYVIIPEESVSTWSGTIDNLK